MYPFLSVSSPWKNLSNFARCSLVTSQTAPSSPPSNMDDFPVLAPVMCLTTPETVATWREAAVKPDRGRSGPPVIWRVTGVYIAPVELEAIVGMLPPTVVRAPEVVVALSMGERGAAPPKLEGFDIGGDSIWVDVDGTEEEVIIGGRVLGSALIDPFIIP